MRVLAYFGGRLLESRGTPSRARNLIQTLGSLPQIELLALSGDSEADARSGLEVDHLPIPAAERRLPCLREAVESFRPDVLYGHTHKAMIEMVHPEFAGTKRVVDLHGHVALERLEAHDKGAARRILGFARSLLADGRRLRAMDGFTACCAPLADRLKRTGKPRRVVWGGVDPDLFQPRSDPPEGPLRVAYAGNFRPYQGVDVLLEAGRRLLEAGEAFEFSFIGGIDSFPEFKARAVEQLGDHLRIHGQIEYRQMPDVLSDANILVIPRPAHGTARFGFPSKLAEYLAMERPTIATRVGDLAHAVVDMETGLLVAPGSAEELVGALLRLKDAELRSRLGKAGRRYAENHLAWPVLARQVESFLQEVLADRG